MDGLEGGEAAAAANPLFLLALFLGSTIHDMPLIGKAPARFPGVCGPYLACKACFCLRP